MIAIQYIKASRTKNTIHCFKSKIRCTTCF